MIDAAARHTRMVNVLNQFYGMSQEKIAEKVGVSFTTVNGWLRRGAKPQARARQEVERAFKVATRDVDSATNRTLAAVSTLAVIYGSPRLANKREPLDELFFILLSLKTSHLTYEETYRTFRAKFHPWSKLLAADIESIEQHIRRGGLGTIKAKAFLDIAKKLRSDFGKVTLSPLRKMPTAEAERYLMSLAGVGIKTARCVLMYSLGHDVVPVDTHTYRVGVRLGLIPTCRTPDEAHTFFDRVVPANVAYALHTNFVAHGQEVCTDQKPRCGECPVNRICKFATQQRTKPHSTPAEPNPRCRTAIGADPTAVDIFAGCGGLSAGLRDAGFRLGYALDWDKHACETHEANFPTSIVECTDVRRTRGSTILAASGGRVDLLAGGPNCQGVSQRGLRSPDDPRNFMFPEFLRIVEEVAPRMVLMENVPGLAHRHNYALLRAIFESFRSVGYRCVADVLLAADYGVPQLRYRFVLIGTRGDEPLTLPAATHAADETIWQKRYVTLGEAIGDLPLTPPKTSDEVEYAKSAVTAYQRFIRDGAAGVTNHTCSATERINIERISKVPEGGNWKDIPADLLPPRFFECRLTDHSTTYARPRRDMPAFTITSLFGNVTAGAFTHPLRDRALTVREGARLQSFKDSFKFYGPSNAQYRQIGNAVPPLLGMAVGRHLRALLAGERPEGRTPRITWERLTDAQAWDALPVLTPRFKALFGSGTRWPKGWGDEPNNRSAVLDGNYKIKPKLRPRKVMAASE